MVAGAKHFARWLRRKRIRACRERAISYGHGYEWDPLDEKELMKQYVASLKGERT
jgi:hypothetical protein